MSDVFEFPCVGILRLLTASVEKYTKLSGLEKEAAPSMSWVAKNGSTILLTKHCSRTCYFCLDLLRLYVLVASKGRAQRDPESQDDRGQSKHLMIPR